MRGEPRGCLTIEEVLKKILQEKECCDREIVTQATYVERQLDNFFSEKVVSWWLSY